MAVDPSLVPDKVSLRDFGAAGAVGENKYSINLYLKRRGDSNIKNNTDLVNKSNFHNDPNFPDRKKQREAIETPTELNMAERMLRRFSFQQLMLQCMAELNIDALVYPTTNLPPAKLGAPDEPSLNGRGDSWNLFGQHGFPAITVPAGFTTTVYDRVRDLSGGTTHLVGPTPAKLPVGVDFAARPFDEALLLRIASAYETASKHRIPPASFGPIRTSN